MIVGILPDPTRSTLWPTIESLLLPAAMKGGEPVLKRNAEVWFATDGWTVRAAVTAYVTTDDAVEVVLGGGDLKALRSIRDRLCQWAKDEGARVVRIIGRPGWAKIFEMDVRERRGARWEMELML